jgi:hypothetical protein
MQGEIMIATTATKIEDLILNITEEIHVKAPLALEKGQKLLLGTWMGTGGSL